MYHRERTILTLLMVGAALAGYLLGFHEGQRGFAVLLVRKFSAPEIDVEKKEK